MKLHAPLGHFRTSKVQLTARFCGAQVELHVPDDAFLKSKDFQAKSPLLKLPVLEAPHATLWESDAIIRFLARSANSALYSGSAEELWEVDMLLDVCKTDLETAVASWLYPVLGKVEGSEELHEASVSEVKASLFFLDSRLKGRHFLVADRLTLADIAWFTVLVPGYRLLFDENFRKPFVNVNKWFAALAQMPEVVAELGRFNLCVQEVKASGDKKKDKKDKKAKKDKKKDKEETKDEGGDKKKKKDKKKEEGEETKEGEKKKKDKKKKDEEGEEPAEETKEGEKKKKDKKKKDEEGEEPAEETKEGEKKKKDKKKKGEEGEEPAEETKEGEKKKKDKKKKKDEEADEPAEEVKEGEKKKKDKKKDAEGEETKEGEKKKKDKKKKDEEAPEESGEKGDKKKKKKKGEEEEAKGETPGEGKKKKKEAPEEGKEGKKKKKDEDEESEEVPRSKNPLDQLPASSFALDEWKRLYANTKQKREVMGEFWAKFDNEGWSLWLLKYQKAEGEGEVVFMTNNLLEGFLARMDHFRRYSFGAMGVYGDEPKLEIQGALLWRGQAVPQELLDHPSFEYYDRTRVDPANAEQRQQVEDFWCNNEEPQTVGGLTVRNWRSFL